MIRSNLELLNRKHHDKSKLTWNVIKSHPLRPKVSVIVGFTSETVPCQRCSQSWQSHYSRKLYLSCNKLGSEKCLVRWNSVERGGNNNETSNRTNRTSRTICWELFSSLLPSSILPYYRHLSVQLDSRSSLLTPQVLTTSVSKILLTACCFQRKLVSWNGENPETTLEVSIESIQIVYWEFTSFHLIFMNFYEEKNVFSDIKIKMFSWISSHLKHKNGILSNNFFHTQLGFTLFKSINLNYTKSLEVW